MPPKTSPHPLVIASGFLFVLVTGGAIAGTIIAIANTLQPRLSSPRQMPPPPIANPAPGQFIPAPTPPVVTTPAPSVNGQWYEPTGQPPVSVSLQEPGNPYRESQPNPQTEIGKCAYPDDLDARGRRCGNRSAYSKGPTTGYDSDR